MLLFIIFSSFIFVVCAQQQNLPPEFLPGGDMEGFTLREDTPEGSIVYTLRGRDPEGTDVTFSVSGDYLSVNRNTGVVSLVQPLDRETVNSIETIITITDGRVFGRDANTVPKRLYISIIDVNDNSPIFQRTPYAFTVSEGVTPGATLFSDIAITDSDARTNAEIKLTCLPEQSSDACEVFDVREAKVGEGNYMGVLSLKRPLDYEQRTSYTLQLKAEDGGGLSTTTTVHVTVRDIQDQPPILLNAPYSASIAEGSKPNKKILEILARDGDLGNPQPITLSLEGDDSNYFALGASQTSEDGTVSAALVTSAIALDREDPIIVQNGGIYSFFVRATEEGGKRETTRSKIVMVVTDVDDMKPFFSVGEATVEVAENIADGTPLPGLDLIVSDEDVGANARFSLRLEGAATQDGVGVHDVRSVFEVFPKEAVGRTPVIVKVINGAALDFENPNANQFAFRVVASQNGEEISSALIKVKVGDSNDNAPVFDFPSYRFSVNEDADPGTSIAVLRANDSDSADFGRVSYSLKGFGSEKFFVDSSTGEISVAPCKGVRSPATCLDFEHQSVYSLTYSGADGGGRVTSVNVFIDVIDVNDNPPAFDRIEYRRTVDEGVQYFDPPLVVKATDADGKDQGGGVVTFAIRDGNTPDGAFGINPTTGELSIRRPLTHMDTPSSIYALTVRATDSGVPPRHSDVRVLITVGRDKNRPPRFSRQTYHASIKENAPPGTLVVTVKARDPDGSDSAIVYQLGSGGGDHFSLDGKSGRIVVSEGAALDRDVEESFQLVVIAIDSGKETRQSSSTLVNITITDINNKSPIFDKKTYVGHVNERASEDEVVLTVKAVDPDIESKLSYSIIDPIFAYDKTGVTLDPGSPFDYANAFSVNETTGDVYVSGRLDHNEAAVIVFSIFVSDLNAEEDYSLQNDTTEVTIYVQVFSAKNPIFASPWTPLRPYLMVNLKEEEPLNEKLFSVAAKDPVTGRMVRRYEKISNSDPSNIFSLDPLTGKVGLNSKLDYEASETKMSSFEVLAISGDRTSQATVQVTIEDINDHSPQFVENEYHTRLYEDAKWPKTVLQVTATDADTGESGQVRYRLGGEDKLLFVINETTGKIQVARGAQLDREVTPTVNLEVTAFDTPNGGVNQRKTTVIVKIELIDVNDEIPLWSNGGHYTAVVPENTPIGSVVLQVSATDPDLGVNGLVSYQIPELQGLDGLFEVDSESGVIRVKAPLSGKGRTDPYDLTVRALDQGTPQQFSEAKVTLFVGDVSLNDGVPVFIRPKPNEVANVMENSPEGTAVFQVEAIDADSSNTANGKIVYSFLESPAKEMPFQIDASSGLITTRGKLDREISPSHSVVVVAQDLGRPPQVTSRILLINVTDADDNDPIFVKLPGKEWIELEVEEEAASGTVVGRVKAIDRDIGENALIDYKITYGNDENLFEIRRTKQNEGEIVVKGRIDREKIAKAELTVACGKLGQRIRDRIPYSASDPSLLRVVVSVKDLDDNKPMFESDFFTAGVRVDAPLQTEVIRLTAVDKDPTSKPIRYSIYNASISQLEDSNKVFSETAVNGSDVFMLEEDTGLLSTSSSLKTYTGDIFTLYVSASSNPDENPVLAKVTIYVLRDTELLRFVFDKNPRKIRGQIPEFVKEVRRSLPVSDALNVYDTSYYDDAQGKIDYERTGACFQLVGRNLDDTKKLLDASNNHRLKNVYNKFSVKSIEPCQPRKLNSASIDWVEIWVLVIAAFIGVGACLASCAVCCLYSWYKKRLRRNMHHMRLLDSPQLATVGGSVGPGSIIMLPPPVMGGHEPPQPRGYEWQERTMPLDAVSYGSVQR